MSSLETIEEKIKSAKPYLKETFGVSHIGYFGSYSKGNFNEDSDVDILVDFDKNPGWEFFDLKDYLQELLHKKVDLVTRGSIKPQLKDQILNQTIYL